MPASLAFCVLGSTKNIGEIDSPDLGPGFCLVCVVVGDVADILKSRSRGFCALSVDVVRWVWECCSKVWTDDR